GRAARSGGGVARWGHRERGAGRVPELPAPHGQACGAAPAACRGASRRGGPLRRVGGAPGRRAGVRALQRHRAGGALPGRGPRRRRGGRGQRGRPRLVARGAGVIPVATAEQARWRDEQAAGLGLPTVALMEVASLRVAECVRRRLPRPDAQVVVLAGGGNNGGDGWGAARWLHGWGVPVRVWALREPRSADA